MKVNFNRVSHRRYRFPDRWRCSSPLWKSWKEIPSSSPSVFNCKAIPGFISCEKLVSCLSILSLPPFSFFLFFSPRHPIQFFFERKSEDFELKKKWTDLFFNVDRRILHKRARFVTQCNIKLNFNIWIIFQTRFIFRRNFYKEVWWRKNLRGNRIDFKLFIIRYLKSQGTNRLCTPRIRSYRIEIRICIINILYL